MAPGSHSSHGTHRGSHSSHGTHWGPCSSHGTWWVVVSTSVLRASAKISLAIISVGGQMPVIRYTCCKILGVMLFLWDVMGGCVNLRAPCLCHNQPCCNECRWPNARNFLLMLQNIESYVLHMESIGCYVPPWQPSGVTLFPWNLSGVTFFPWDTSGVTFFPWDTSGVTFFP